MKKNIYKKNRGELNHLIREKKNDIFFLKENFIDSNRSSNKRKAVR